MNPAAWHQVKLIVEYALTKPSHARRELVERACAHDVDLLNEVISLLDEADADSNGFLESPIAWPENLSDPTFEWIGRRLAAFRIVRRIGAGGMGDVYLAQREEGMGRETVAVKVMRDGVDSPAMRRRFEQEQRLHARLGHPFVAQMLGQGIVDDQPYMLLEHIDGLAIDAHCRHRRLGLRARIQLVIDVCGAIHHSHARSIVHCDIKPANVLVTAQGRPKLLDFGISEVLWPDEPVPRSTIAHLEGVAMFTPECAAPEQLQNDVLTQATDIYGLGLLLFQLLTGRMPHAAYRSGLTLPRVRAVCDEDPMPLSLVFDRFGVDEELGLPETDDLGWLRSGRMDHILQKALARKPSARYASAAAFTEELRRLWLMPPERYRLREEVAALRLSAACARRMPPRR